MNVSDVFKYFICSYDVLSRLAMKVGHITITIICTFTWLALTFSGGKKLSKLFVTLHIRNVTVDDDSTRGPLGRYECHAYAVADPKGKKHSFTVIVIRRKLPFTPAL